MPTINTTPEQHRWLQSLVNTEAQKETPSNTNNQGESSIAQSTLMTLHELNTGDTVGLLPRLDQVRDPTADKAFAMSNSLILRGGGGHFPGDQGETCLLELILDSAHNAALVFANQVCGEDHWSEIFVGNDGSFSFGGDNIGTNAPTLQITPHDGMVHSSGGFQADSLPIRGSCVLPINQGIPVTANAPGIVGRISYDGSFLYICTLGGPIASSSLVFGGSGYAVGDIFNVITHNGFSSPDDATGIVDSISGPGPKGPVATYHLTSNGTFESTDRATITNNTSGTGIGLVLSVVNASATWLRTPLSTW